MVNQGSLREQWERLLRRRNVVVKRAEDASRVTIPHIMPPEGHTESSELPTPYQSLGAKAVNNLAAKFLLALFPPNTSFFKLNFDDLTRTQLESGGQNVEQIVKDLSLIEQVTVAELEQTKLRSAMSQAFKHLIVTGNGVVNINKDGQFRFFGLRHFVVNRDPEGTVLLLIIKEQVAPSTLSREIQDACFDQREQLAYSTDPEKTADLYTVMELIDDHYEVRQEVNNTVIPNSAGKYPKDAPAYIVLRWTAITDEDYGRGLVDEYIGDFNALDDLSRDLLKASAIAAKVIFAVDPNSHITPSQLSKALSGDALRGKAEDVGTIGVDKLQDFSIALDRLRDIQRDLSEAFLMNQSVQRDAERVTAEEIRFMAQELEDALGGVYSILAQDLQAPLVRRVLSVLMRKRLIPNLPKKELKLQITTGLEALGRGHEINKMMTFIQLAGQLLGPEQMQMRLDVQGLLTRLATGIGINTENLIKSEEKVQEDMQQAQAAAVAQQSIPGMAQEAMKQGGIPNG